MATAKTKKVEIEEDTTLSTREVIEAHAQPAAQIYAIAFNKRFNQLRDGGATDHEAYIILMGELAYNMAQSKK